MGGCRKPALAELLALEAREGAAHHGGITHFKESGDVYPHDSDGWPVDPGRAGGLGDQRGSGRLAGVKKPARGGLSIRPLCLGKLSDFLHGCCTSSRNNNDFLSR